MRPNHCDQTFPFNSHITEEIIKKFQSLESNIKVGMIALYLVIETVDLVIVAVA